MPKRRRSTRRHRRDPVRRPIPTVPQLTARPVRGDDLMPIYEYSPMFGLLTEAPTEMVPLHAVLAVPHQALSGKPVGSCVLSCHQIAGALRHFGFDAEPIAACATVYRTTDTFAEVSEVGTRKRPPTVRPDGTTNGHMVVWTPSFGQLVDATLVQDPMLLSIACQDLVYSMPVLVTVPADRDELLRSQPCWRWTSSCTRRGSCCRNGRRSWTRSCAGRWVLRRGWARWGWQPTPST